MIPLLYLPENAFKEPLLSMFKFYLTETPTRDNLIRAGLMGSHIEVLSGGWFNRGEEGWDTPVFAYPIPEFWSNPDVTDDALKTSWAEKPTYAHELEVLVEDLKKDEHERNSKASLKRFEEV